MRSLVCLAILALLSAATARSQQASATKTAPPDPCAATTSQEERNQCWDDLYHKADAQLTALYRKILSDIRSTASQRQGILQFHEETALSKLKAAELAWERYRNLQCDAAEQQYEGGMISPSVRAGCAKTLTGERMAELKKTYAIYLLPQ